MKLTEKPGGTEGGEGHFLAGAGFILAALGLYFLFDSVHVSTDGAGAVSGLLRGGGAGGMWGTTSMGVIFVPFLIGVAVLFYDAKLTWGWWLFWLGLAVIAVEILSRLRFQFSMKTTHLLIILGMTAAGAGMMMRAYRMDREKERAAADKKKSDGGESAE